MKKRGNKRLITVLIVIPLILAGLFTAKPQIENKIRNLIIQQALQLDQVEDAKLGQARIKFLPPHIRLQDLKVQLKDIEEVKTVSVKRVAVYPYLVNLFSAQLKIKHVHVDGTQLEIHKSTKKSDQGLPDFSYTDLRSLPLSSLILTNTNLKYEEFEVLAKRISFRKRWNSVEGKLRNVIATDSTGTLPASRLQNMRVNLYSDKITLGNFTLNTENSHLQIGANFNEVFNLKLIENPQALLDAELNVTAKLELADFKNLAQRFTDAKGPVKLDGTLQLAVYSKIETDNKPKLTFNFQLNQLDTDMVAVESIEVLGNYKNNLAHIYKLHIEDEKLDALSKDIKLNVDLAKKTASVNGGLNLNQFEVAHFLKHNLDLGTIPLSAPITAEINCQGPVYPKPLAECELDGNFKQLKVWSDSSRPTESMIADLTAHKVFATGILGTQGLTYQSSHQFTESLIKTSGSVDYIKGFDISYDSDFFSFNDLNNLANIPMSGFGKVKGQTQGSAKWGTFEADIDLTDFNFFEYYFGATQSQISYQQGKIQFKNSQAKIKSSLIYADVNLDVIENQIEIKAHSNKLFVQDVLTAIEQVAEVPIYISGEGQLDVNLSGPLELGKMSYDIKGKFNNGILHKDRYRNFDLDIKSIDGQVDVKSSLFYLSDQFNIEGKVDPQGMVDVMALADSINLSNINFFKELGINLEGVASVKINLKNHILLPDVSGQAVTKALNTNTQLGSSDFEFIIHKDYSEFEGTFFDGRAQGRFLIPHSDSAPMGAIATYSDFNPMALLTMFNSSKVTETEAKINFTGSSNLISHGDFRKNLSGNLIFESIRIGQDATYNLQSVGHTEIQFDKSKIDGQVRLKDTYDNMFNILFDSKDINRAEGQLNLNFLKAFIPDLTDSRGMLDIRSTFKLFPKFEMNGSGNIQNLFVKIENLKHPFQNISSDLVLQNTKVLFQGTRGEFANGTIDGAGYIDFRKGLKVNFAGKADRINLDVPEDVKTTSSGNFHFIGDDFPYTLGGNFKIHDGYFEMPFTSDDSGRYSIAISQYIPESDRSRTPMLLDVKLTTLQPIKVKNPMVDGSATADLHIQGSPTQPILTGEVTVVPNTMLIFQDKRFRTTSGQITFNQSAPENAQLDISAETRITDNNEILGKDYDIQVVIQGSANSPSLFFSSQPNLSETQILSLIALGVKDSYRPGQEVSSDSQQSQTGYQLGGIFLQNEFARDLQDRLGVQVNFTSSFEDQDVSPKVMIQKKFNPKFSITGSRTLGTNKRTSTQIEYKFNRNFSIISGWENYDLEDATLLRTRRFLEPNVVGVDVQYSFEFD